MTVELALCLLAAAMALPVSRSVMVHYIAMASVNLAFLGIAEADSSLLAITFGALAAFDCLLILSGGRLLLLVPAIASFLLCVESVANQDWLLSHVTYLSAAVNAVIAACLAKEYGAWMRGRFLR